MSDEEYASGADDGVDLGDAGDRVEEVVWVPSRLPVTEQRMLQAAHDKNKLGNSRCMLCAYADDKTGSARKVTEIYELESTQRRNMDQEELFKAIVKKFNDELIEHRRRYLGDVNAKKICIEEVRRHFLGNHDRDIKRMLEDRMDYLSEFTVALEEGGLWLKNNNDPSAPLMPHRQNMNTYVVAIRTMESLYNRLQSKSSLANTSGVGKKKRPLPKGAR